MKPGDIWRFRNPTQWAKHNALDCKLVRVSGIEVTVKYLCDNAIDSIPFEQFIERYMPKDRWPKPKQSETKQALSNFAKKVRSAR